MKITKGKLTKLNACSSARNYFKENKGFYGLELADFLKKLMQKKWQDKIKQECNDNSLVWANWLIVRCMKRKQYLAYAVFAARQVLSIYEKKYLNDDRPRKAIEAVEKCIKSDTKKNRYAAAAAAANAAAAAANAADAAYAAAYAAANAAYAAANAAYAADAAANAAAAADAAYAAANAAAAIKKMRIKILNYGIKLLNQ